MSQLRRDILAIRPRPLPGEIFSSWLVRLAWGNAQKLHPFTTNVLGFERFFWAADVDRTTASDKFARLALLTGVHDSRIRRTTISGLAGIILEQMPSLGPINWILPIGRSGRTHKRPGQQFCAQCLSSDPTPYFRLSWRLGCVVGCGHHHHLLRDRCPKCGASVSFHESDYGRRKFPSTCELTICRRCLFDLRDSDVVFGETPLNDTLLQYQNIVDIALSTGWAKLPKLPHMMALNFFNGLHVLARQFASNGRLRPLR